MKLLGFYISRTDWEDRYVKDNKRLLNLILELETQLEKPRDSKGRFISKQDLMTEQLKAERDNKHVPHWDDIKAAK